MHAPLKYTFFKPLQCFPWMLFWMVLTTHILIVIRFQNMEKIGGKKMNEQWTREEKETWNQKYYQSLDMSLKIYPVQT